MLNISKRPSTQKSFIHLKPYSSTLSKPLPLNLSLLLDLLPIILPFLTLSQILLLYKLYKNSTQKDIPKAIIKYMTISQIQHEEKEFLVQVIKGERKVWIANYNKRNLQYEEIISMDVERTNLKHFVMSNQSSRDFLQAKSIIKPNCAIQQINNSTSINMKRSSLNFHYGQVKQKQQNSQQETALKSYLKTVLNAISNRNKKIGYVQGLNFWVKHMYESKLSQQQAFSYSCFILQNLRGQNLFSMGMPLVHQLCFILQVYLSNNLPSLSSHLHQTSCLTYASPWFLTLFTQELSTPTINKLWHLFVMQGYKVFIQFGVAVLCAMEREISKVKREDLNQYMRGVLGRIDRRKLKLVWKILPSVKVSNTTMQYLAKEMKILANDTQIQLWRLEHQLNFVSMARSSRLTCRPRWRNSCSGHQQLDQSSFRQSSYHRSWKQPRKSFQFQKLHTQATQQNYSILSLCKSVDYV